MALNKQNKKVQKRFLQGAKDKAKRTAKTPFYRQKALYSF